MTKKLTVMCAGLALAVAMTAGCSKKAEQGGAQSAAKAPAPSTVVYKAPDGSFSVELPEKYKEMQATSQQVPGSTASMGSYMAGSEADGIMFMVATLPGANVPEGTDINPVLDTSLKGMVADGTIISQSKITIDGNPGITARVKKTQGEQVLFMDWAETVIAGTVYQISLMSNEEKKLDDPAAQAFMKSFKFTGKK